MTITVPASSQCIPWPSSTAAVGRSADCTSSGASANCTTNGPASAMIRPTVVGRLSGRCRAAGAALLIVLPDVYPGQRREPRSSPTNRHGDGDDPGDDYVQHRRCSSRSDHCRQEHRQVHCCVEQNHDAETAPGWLNSHVNSTESPTVQPMNPPIAKAGLVLSRISDWPVPTRSTRGDARPQISPRTMLASSALRRCCSRGKAKPRQPSSSPTGHPETAPARIRPTRHRQR